MVPQVWSERAVPWLMPVVAAQLRGRGWAPDLIKDLTEEIVQETIRRSRGDSRDGEVKPRAYPDETQYGRTCVTIAKNLIRDRWRNLSQRREQPLHEADHHPVRDSAEKANQLRHELACCLDRLPEELRTVLLLRYEEELSRTETAERLGVSIETVSRRTTRARELLRVCLSDEGLAR